MGPKKPPKKKEEEEEDPPKQKKKRVYTKEQLRRKAQHQAEYRARMSLNPEWKKGQVLRVQVIMNKKIKWNKTNSEI